MTIIKHIKLYKKKTATKLYKKPATKLYKIIQKPATKLYKNLQQNFLKQSVSTRILLQ